jgi:hypothetical protein
MFLSAALQGLVPPCARTARAMGVSPSPWRTILHRSPSQCFSQRRPADGWRADIGGRPIASLLTLPSAGHMSPPDLNSSEVLS